MEVNNLSPLRRCLAFHCQLCHSVSTAGDGLCHACRRDLPLIQSACQRCGIALWHEGICGLCLQSPTAVDRIVAPLAYRYPVTEIIKNIKYKQKVTLIPVLAALLVRKLSSIPDAYPEMMIPVPLSFRRWVSRGFNQSIEICRFLHRQLRVPFDATLVHRVKNTPPLYPLTPNERTRQLRGVFTINGVVPCRSVAIVDDVVTTGSTVNEMATLLRSQGVGHVEVWTLARTC